MRTFIITALLIILSFALDSKPIDFKVCAENPILRAWQ
jgi:hypothetical protein